MVYNLLKNILCLDQPYATRVLVFLMYLTMYFIVDFNLIVGIEPQFNHNLLLLLAFSTAPYQ